MDGTPQPPPPPAPPATPQQQTMYPTSTSSCLFCSRPWTDHEHHHFIVEDRKRKLESLSNDHSFNGTMFRYILANSSPTPSPFPGNDHKEILNRLVRVSSHNRSTGDHQLPLCNTCLGLIYELRELHVTLERIQNLIIDKVKEIKGQFSLQQQLNSQQLQGDGGEEQGGSEDHSNSAWGTPEHQEHPYLFPFPNPAELGTGGGGGTVTPNFALQSLLMKGDGGVGGEIDIARSLKMDSEARAAVEDTLGGDMNVPSSSQSDCGSSVADGSIDGMNFDGTRRGRRRKPVQLVDNAKKSKQDLISHMKSVNKDLFICDIDGCYAFFNTVQGLSQHKRQHFRDSWPVCGVCNYTTPWPSAMNRHFSTQHPGVEKDIKRASRRNPSCAFTVDAFLQQNENPESPSTSSGGGKQPHRNSSTAQNNHQSHQHPQSSSNSATTSLTMPTPIAPHNSHPSQPPPIPMTSAPTSLLQWKATQNSVSMASAAAAAAAAFTNSHQRRFCPTGFNFNDGPR